MIFSKLSDGIWVLEGDPITFLTFPYEIRCTVIELNRDELFIHSPVQIKAASQLKALPGKVKHIVSPNKLHSLFLEDWKQTFPQARLYAPPGLKTKLSGLPFDKELSDEAEPEWLEVIEQKIIQGSWFMSEVVFFHKPSETLILGDLIENHNPQKLGWLHRSIGIAMGIIAPNGTTARIYRLTFSQRDRVRRDLHEVLNWNAKRVVVNHGAIVENTAQSFLLNAFKWAL